MYLRQLVVVSLLLPLAGCGRDVGHSITVAAAANLSGAFQEVAARFTAESGVGVVYSYASTAQLAHQVEGSAPFDVFAAADIAHVDALVEKGLLLAETRAIYARGQLALWIPRGEPAADVLVLTHPSIRFIAIAKPAAAPYGQAAVETLQSSGIWANVQPKIVYAGNIGMAKQFAATGNADAAFTAYSLLLGEKGTIVVVDPKLHAPLDQALAVVASSRQPKNARRFVAFVLGSGGRSILSKYGYKVP